MQQILLTAKHDVLNDSSRRFVLNCFVSGKNTKSAIWTKVWGIKVPGYKSNFFGSTF